MSMHRYDPRDRFAPSFVAEGGAPAYDAPDAPLDIDALLAEIGLPAHTVRALRAGADGPGASGAAE